MCCVCKVQYRQNGRGSASWMTELWSPLSQCNKGQLWELQPLLALCTEAHGRSCDYHSCSALKSTLPLVLHEGRPREPPLTLHFPQRRTEGATITAHTMHRGHWTYRSSDRATIAACGSPPCTCFLLLSWPRRPWSPLKFCTEAKQGTYIKWSVCTVLGQNCALLSVNQLSTPVWCVLSAIPRRSL